MVLGEQGHREQNSGSYGKLLNKKKVLLSEEEKAENAHISNEKSDEVPRESSKSQKRSSCEHPFKVSSFFLFVPLLVMFLFYWMRCNVQCLR
jgi:hypothetical protein